MIGFNEINTMINNLGKIELRKQSAVNESNNLYKLINTIQPKIMLEIGTFNGLSTAVIASFADKVYTVDIAYREETQVVWDYFGLKDKIIYKIFKNRNEIREYIKTIKYDSVYIDANHKYEEVKADYEMVKDCDSILFHDYHLDGVRQLINEIDGQPLAEFVYKGTQQVKGHYKMAWKTDPLFLGKVLENNY
jgi:bisphosphoglycerate-independent phosphoglycerate mutase (AlkP superfamily)